MFAGGRGFPGIAGFEEAVRLRKVSSSCGKLVRIIDRAGVHMPTRSMAPRPIMVPPKGMHSPSPLRGFLFACRPNLSCRPD